MPPDSHGEGQPNAPDGRSAFERGNELARDGELEQADAAYREADEAGHPTAAAYAGVFAESRGEMKQAREAYQRADERGDGLGSLRLGLLLSRAGQWREAEKLFARSDERGYDQPPFHTEELLGLRSVQAPAPMSGQRSPWANPVLVGAVTVLIAIVAVFLAYSANRGLPFVPTKELKIEIGNGSELVTGNDVREGRFRIGLVSEMKPIELPNGQVGAQLILKLSQSRARIPVDSTATILPRSVLGTKYVSLNIGTSSRLIPDGGTLALGGIHISAIPSLDYDLLYQERVVRSVANNTRQDGHDFLRVAAEIWHAQGRRIFAVAVSGAQAQRNERRRPHHWRWRRRVWNSASRD